ncbi:MAG: hypothetical protein PVH61_38185 [Candidatus Aminicenantes bacterium]|jgi:hypothetical protein
MKKDADETRKNTALNNTALQIQEELQEHKSENREDNFTGNRILETAISQGLIRKSVLRNPRYLLVLRRLRLKAYRQAESEKHTGKNKNPEYLDPKKIFSN